MEHASRLGSSARDIDCRSSLRGIRAKLLRWFQANGRSFYWREHTDPYVVLISEVLLKKTTAAVVDRFLPGFLRRYPTIDALASARVGSLRRLLQPLGLSDQRSRQLLAVAKAIQSTTGGAVPSTLGDLLKLPGVGPYAANSVLCVAHQQAAPIVDTNVARILLRVFDVAPTRYEARRCPVVWDLARDVAGRRASAAKNVNWAMLDLGALICTATGPRCRMCPLRSCCRYAMRQNIAASANGAQ
jgi:A/G-specific adenine glycosylase